MSRRCIVLCFVIAFFGLSLTAAAQSTAFTYQGVLKDASAPANGNYYFEFELYDAATFGNQLGSTIIFNTVPVSNGSFTVGLDFGNQFNGSNRYLLIRVRAPFGVTTTLSPRQLITSTPNALNANLLGGLAPSAYIQNSTNQQANTNLSISGSALFGGNVGVGTLTPNAKLNVVGSQPPPANQTPMTGTNAATVLDVLAGNGGNTSGGNQSDFGGTGGNVMIRGGDGGQNPTTDTKDGNGGSITLQPGLTRSPALNGNVLLAPSGGKVGVGTIAPSATLTVVNPQAGIINPSPANIPPAAIRGEATSASNSTIGVLGVASSVGGVGVIGITNGTGDTGKGGDATAVLGLASSPTGETTGLSSEVNSPDGTALDMHMPTGGTGNLIYASTRAPEGTGSSTTVFTVNSVGRVFSNAGIWAKGFHLNSTNADLLENGDFITGGTVSANGVDTTSNITVGGQIFGNAGTLTIGSNMNINGTVTPQMLSSGNTQICTLTGTSTLRFCTSSLRYKTDIHPYTRGLDIIRQLNPISFNWKENGTPDVGLGAEDVAKVEPLLTFENAEGEIEGVRYNQMNAVFVNAFKEQQAQIEAQAKLIANQNQEMTRLSREVNALKRKLKTPRRR